MSKYLVFTRNWQTEWDTAEEAIAKAREIEPTVPAGGVLIEIEKQVFYASELEALCKRVEVAANKLGFTQLRIEGA